MLIEKSLGFIFTEKIYYAFLKFSKQFHVDIKIIKIDLEYKDVGVVQGFKFLFKSHLLLYDILFWKIGVSSPIMHKNDEKLYVFTVYTRPTLLSLTVYASLNNPQYYKIMNLQKLQVFPNILNLMKTICCWVLDKFGQICFNDTE